MLQLKNVGCGPRALLIKDPDKNIIVVLEKIILDKQDPSSGVLDYSPGEPLSWTSRT